MKRSWFGLGLLAVLLVVSLLAAGFMGRSHEEMALDLKQSAQCALLGDWENVGFYLKTAERAWEKSDFLRSCFAHQGEMEAVEASLAALKIWLEVKDAAAYRAACAALTKQVEALGEAQRLSWRNLF